MMRRGKCPLPTELWFADYLIRKAATLEDLKEAEMILQWVAEHALPSGVLA
jgi:GH15 family glucan-1,4-alpha-glucosidase